MLAQIISLFVHNAIQALSVKFASKGSKKLMLLTLHLVNKFVEMEFPLFSNVTMEI